MAEHSEDRPLSGALRPVTLGADDDRLAADDAHERHRQGTRGLFVARCLLFASAYVVAAVLARKLGSSEYGVYGVIVSQLLWIEMFLNAGVPAATAKLVAEGRHDRGEVERSSRAILVMLSLVLLGVCWVLAPTIANLMQLPDSAHLFRIAALDLPFAGLYAAYDGILYGRRRFATLAQALVLLAVVKVGGVLALLAWGVTLERVLGVFVVATSVLSVTLAVRCRVEGFRPRRSVMRDVVLMAAPLGVFLIASNVLVTVDLWSLQSLWQGRGDIVGHYVAAANLARMLMVVPAAQAGVLFASVAWAVAARESEQASQHVREATRFALIIAVGANAVLAWDAADILALLFSSPYADGQPFMRLLLLGFGLFTLLDVFATALMAAGWRWLVSLAVTAIVPIVWLTNVLIVPRFGPLGAATAMALGMALAAASIGAMTASRFGSVLAWPTVGRVLLAATVVALPGMLVHVPSALLLGKLALLGVLYLGVLWWSGEISARDFRSPLAGARQQSV